MKMSVPDNAGGDRKLLTLQNMTSQPIKWKLKVSKVKGLRSKETAFVFLKQGGADYQQNKIQGEVAPGESYRVTIVFCPRKVGSYGCEIPMYIDHDDYCRPYRTIKLDAYMQQSRISFLPPVLNLTPVPLQIQAQGQFTIVATGFCKSTALRVEMVQNKNDEKYDVHENFDIKFPNGLVIN